MQNSSNILTATRTTTTKCNNENAVDSNLNYILVIHDFSLRCSRFDIVNHRSISNPWLNKIYLHTMVIRQRERAFMFVAFRIGYISISIIDTCLFPNRPQHSTAPTDLKELSVTNYWLTALRCHTEICSSFRCECARTTWNKRVLNEHCAVIGLVFSLK